MLHFYGLPYRIYNSHQDSCAVVGVAYLCRQRSGLARDLGFVRQFNKQKIN